MFWAYTAFSEYLLTWYANMKEEIPHFLIRQHGLWAILAGCFVVFGIDDRRAGTQHPVLVGEFREGAGVSPEAVALACRAAAVKSTGVTFGDVVLVPPGTLLKTTSGKRRHKH